MNGKMSPRLYPRWILLLAWVAALFVSSELPTAKANYSTPCPAVRVRREWDDLEPAEKALYRDAISMAMQRGYHARFAEVLTDTASFVEAYYTCGTFFWHRRYLLAYENMLRSLDPRFACITIPYWDFFSDYAVAILDPTSSFQSASSFLREFGGSQNTTNSATVSTVINNVGFSGVCVNGTNDNSSVADFSNFYTSSEPTSSGQYLGCIPRGPWSTTPFPSGFGYSTLSIWLSQKLQFGWFTDSVIYGWIFPMHSKLGGAIATMATAADPVFLSVHAMFDVVHHLFYSCHTDESLTDAEKQSGMYAYQQCSRYTSVTCPTRMSDMTQFLKPGSKVRRRVEEDEILAPFFFPPSETSPPEYLPSQYWNYPSTDDLGYTYELSTALETLVVPQMSCTHSFTRRRLQTTTESTASIAKRNRATRKTYNAHRDILLDARAVSSSEEESLDQVNLIECAYYDSLFRVDDLTDEFRQGFGAPSSLHTPCYNQLRALQSGRKKIRVAKWKEKYEYLLRKSDAEVDQDLSNTGDTVALDQRTMGTAL